MKFRDGGTGALLGEASDRQVDPMTLLVNIKDFTQYGHARNTIDRWAKVSAEFLTTPPNHKISRPLPISFSFW